jgi:hypothetical protein
LAIDIEQAPIWLARKETPLQIGMTQPIIKMMNMTNYILHIDCGLRRGPMSRNQSINRGELACNLITLPRIAI